MDKRVIMRVELEPGSKIGLDDFCDRTGMTKVAVLSRMIDWFCDQPEGLQAIIQGLLPELIHGDVAEMVLKRLKTEKMSGKRSMREDMHEHVNGDGNGMRTSGSGARRSEERLAMKSG